MKKDFNINYKEEYKKWIEKKKVTPSYIKSIEILSEILKYDIFKIDNTEELKILYKDLLIEQKNINGKYYHKDAPSYGNNGFYSASINS